jgi:hypothetical protein
VNKKRIKKKKNMLDNNNNNNKKKRRNWGKTRKLWLVIQFFPPSWLLISPRLK